MKSPVFLKIWLSMALLVACASGAIAAVVTSGTQRPTTSTAPPMEAGVMPKSSPNAPVTEIVLDPPDVAPDEALVEGSVLRRAIPGPDAEPPGGISTIPEPASIGLGLLGLLGILRRRQK